RSESSRPGAAASRRPSASTPPRPAGRGAGESSATPLTRPVSQRRPTARAGRCGASPHDALGRGLIGAMGSGHPAPDRWPWRAQVDLTITTREAEGRTVVAVAGEIDVYTAPRLRESITELVASGTYDLVVDMSEVEFLDSTGLGVLVGGLKKVRAHDGSLQLVCNQDRLLKIFRITGLAKVFVIHDTAEAALAAG